MRDILFLIIFEINEIIIALSCRLDDISFDISRNFLYRLAKNFLYHQLKDSFVRRVNLNYGSTVIGLQGTKVD